MQKLSHTTYHLATVHPLQIMTNREMTDKWHIVP